MKSEEFSLQQQQQQWRIYSLCEGLSLGRLLPSTCQRVCVYVIFRYLNPCGGELMVSVSGGSLLGGRRGCGLHVTVQPLAAAPSYIWW